MEFSLERTAKEHIMITAHRGVSGGNIPCNTMAAYEIALKQGADIIEADVSCSLDGKLFLFHPMMETAHLNRPVMLNTLPYSLVKQFHYVNGDNTQTQFKIADFDEFLEQFKGRCFINIDKFWSNPKKIYDAVKRHDMTEQILVKSEMNKKVLSVLEEVAPNLPFMPIVRDVHPAHEQLLRSRVNYVGVEVLFKDDGAEVASEKFLQKMHRDKVLVWVNSIIYNYKNQLAGGHSDDTALTESEEKGWGWLSDRGFDIIQTDWPGMLIDYLKKTDRYYR